MGEPTRGGRVSAEVPLQVQWVTPWEAPCRRLCARPCHRYGRCGGLCAKRRTVLCCTSSRHGTQSIDERGPVPLHTDWHWLPRVSGAIVVILIAGLLLYSE